MDFKVRFSGRSHFYTEEEIDIVVNVMRTSTGLTQGLNRDLFESKFKKKFNVKHAFAVCNATAALELCAQLCQFKPEDEIIIPSHTFTSSAYPFQKHGATIKWCDIDLRTRVTNLDFIKKQVTPKTKAILVPHLYGYMANIEEVAIFAKNNNIIVIEDAAQSIGTKYNGKFSGTVGDLGVFSFHSHKNITTLGEGGMLVTNNDKFANIIPMLRHNGHCTFNYERENYWQPCMGNIDIPSLNNEFILPSNYCLGEVECALGAKLLDRLDEINFDKRKKALDFIDSLKSYPDIEFFREDSERHNYHLLVARILNNKRDQFIKKMAFEKKIQCVVQYYPLHRYDYYKKLNLGSAKVPNTDEFFDNMVSIPFNSLLKSDEIEYVKKSCAEVLTELE